MTVGELRELLDDYGDHLEVELYDDEGDTVYSIDSVEFGNTPDGPRVTIAFSEPV